MSLHDGKRRASTKTEKMQLRWGKNTLQEEVPDKERKVIPIASFPKTPTVSRVAEEKPRKNLVPQSRECRRREGKILVGSIKGVPKHIGVGGGTKTPT